MEVTVAKTAGFCFGVKRAVKTVDEAIEKRQKGVTIYTYGPIIHNADVIKHFEEQRVYAVSSLEEIDGPETAQQQSVLIIRAHGVPESIVKAAEEKGLQVVDATCPFVKKIHNIVREKSRAGGTIVVVGDAKHPEVVGITGWIEGPYFVVGSKEEALALPEFENTPVTVVFQTTFDTLNYKDFVEIITKKGYDMNVINTICNATAERQSEAAVISKSADVMLVVGDRSSANTNRLYEICKTYCNDTYYIQKTDDLELTNLQSGISVGITAGASTPENIIQEVFLNVRRKKF